MTGDSVVPAVADATQQAFGWSCVWLFFLGVSAGLFDIPLEAYLQLRSDPRVRGSILAANNFISYTCMLGAAGLFWLMQTQFHWSASTIFLAAGLGTVPVAIYVVCLIPQATVRCIVWIISKLMYRLRVRGLENLPQTGGALLVANHVSWLDGVLLLLVSTRPIRMLAYSDYVTGWWINWLATMWNVIPIRNTDGPKALIHSLNVGERGVDRRRSRLHFRRGGHHAERPTAAVPARLVADRRRDRLPRDSRLSRRVVGKYVQFQRRSILLEMASTLAVSGLDQFRPASLRPGQRRSGPAGRAMSGSRIDGGAQGPASRAAAKGGAPAQEDPFPLENRRFRRPENDGRQDAWPPPSSSGG